MNIYLYLHKFLSFCFFFNFTVLTADKAQQQNDEYNGIHQEITLKKILQGQVVSLESYKSLASKTSLLDAAIASGNGNAILGVCTFQPFIMHYLYNL